jgi:ribosomal protein S14
MHSEKKPYESCLTTASEACTRPLLVHHVARRIERSRRMVRHLAETGKLRGFKVGRKIWKFWPSEVERFKARRRLPDA